MPNKKEPNFEVGKTLKSYQPPGTVVPVVPKLPPKPKKPLPRRILSYTLLVVLSLFIGIGVWDAVNLSRATTKTFGSGNFLSLLAPHAIKEQNGRTNILLVGYSLDDPGHPGAVLTDSIILLSLSTTNHTGYMLSIPRDLYVRIPGYGYGKINEAYRDGGMSTLAGIVSDKFNSPIDYTVLINYAAVRDTVNALGGVNVNIKSPDPRGLLDTNISLADGGPLKLSNGLHKLDGQTALNLARARGDAYGSYGFPQADFDRTEHQRQILLAIKEKVSLWLILNPLKNGRLLSAVGQNTITDVKVHEARPLFSLLNRANPASLKSYSLRNLNGKNYLVDYLTPTGESALVPTAGLNDYTQIDAAVNSANQ